MNSDDTIRTRAALATLDASLNGMDASLARLHAMARTPRPAAAVIVVDDNAPYAEGIAALLRTRLGIEVVVVTDPHKAHAQLTSRVWSLALLDLHLGSPDVNGIDLLRALPRSTPVILVSGVLPNELDTIARRERADAHFAKPHEDIGAVIECARGLLGRRSPPTPATTFQPLPPRAPR
jgi:DNA-binding response OmpR family regulator